MRQTVRTSTILEQLRKAVAVGCALLLTPATPLLLAQDQAPPPPEQQEQLAQQAPQASAPLMAPQQLDGLVAPIALYPDSLLSQVLVAATYPLEIVEANQWLQQNRNLQGQALIQAAQQQNWDPSIQALVAFPDVVGRLAQDVRWVTDLGNAFLAQQADVMASIQRLRAQAQASGKLTSNQQEVVKTEDQDGRQAIEIDPANPQVVYVPTYNPAYFWGDVYPYPPLFYPGIGVGWGFGFGVSLGLYFGGCCGWGGWGWGPNWFGHSVFVNGGFFHRYRFNDFHGGGFGRAAWVHDPGHRLGVAYPNRAVAAQFRGNANGFNRGVAGNNFNRGANLAPAANRGGFNNAANRGGFNNAPAINRSYAPSGASERVGNREVPQANYGSHSAFGPVQNGNATRVQSDHGYSSMHSSGGGRVAPEAHVSGGGGGGSHGGGGGGSHGGGGGGRR